MQFEFIHNHLCHFWALFKCQLCQFLILVLFSSWLSFLSSQQKATPHNLVKQPPLFNFLPTNSYCSSAWSIRVKVAKHHIQKQQFYPSQELVQIWSLGCLRRQFQYSHFSVWMMISIILQTRRLGSLKHVTTREWWVSRSFYWQWISMFDMFGLVWFPPFAHAPMWYYRYI